MRNGIDTMTLAIRIAERVAMAPFDVLEAEAFRLGVLVHEGALSKQVAVDMLHHAALGSNLYRFGTETVQEVIAGGFPIAPDGGEG